MEQGIRQELVGRVTPLTLDEDRLDATLCPFFDQFLSFSLCFKAKFSALDFVLLRQEEEQSILLSC